MEYAYFSSMGQLFFSVLRGGGDEMGREGTKSGQPQRCGCPLGLGVGAGGVTHQMEGRRSGPYFVG